MLVSLQTLRYFHAAFADSIAATLQFLSKNHHIVMPFRYNMIICNILNVSFQEAKIQCFIGYTKYVLITN